MGRQMAIAATGACGIVALSAVLAPLTAAQAAPHRHVPLPATAAVPATAPAVTPAGTWRIAHVNRAAGHDILTAITAISRRDAWAGGAVSKLGSHVLLQHWNGRTWTRANLPAGLRKIGSAQVTGLEASGRRNVWAFVSGHPAAVARFNGHRWQVVREWPSAGFPISGEVFSRKDVWMFGGIGPKTVGTWHWNGRTWTRPKMPLTAFDVSRVSAKDEWGVGERLTKAGTYAGGVERWNGRSWNVVPTRGLIPADTASRSTSVNQVLARSGSDVWVTGTSYTRSFRHLRSFLLHWNGHAWQRISGKGDVSLGPAVLTRHGVTAVEQHVRLGNQHFIDTSPGFGRYAGTLTKAQRRDARRQARWLRHHRRHAHRAQLRRHLRRAARDQVVRYRVSRSVPTHPGRALQINGLAAIPGTGSAWAVGGYYSDTARKGWIPLGGVLLRQTG
ncbi:MAG: hypothetical protein ABJB47_04965 [Actinomycetota bacterium]